MASISGVNRNQITLPINPRREEISPLLYLATAVTFTFFTLFPATIAHFKKPENQSAIMTDIVRTYALIGATMSVTAGFLHNRHIQLKASHRAIAYTLIGSSLFSALCRIDQLGGNNFPPLGERAETFYTCMVGILNTAHFLKRNHNLYEDEVEMTQIRSV